MKAWPVRIGRRDYRVVADALNAILAEEEILQAAS
jgi:hypothetical protein